MMCQEFGVKYELIPVDLFKGEQKDPQWIATKQPFGAVPVLVDEDGTQLFESRAIARYLVLKYGPTSGLIPPSTEPKSWGLFEQAASIEYSSFAPPLIQIYREHVFAGLEGRPLNQELLDRYRKMLFDCFEGYERILSNQKYLAGEKLTLADLFHVPSGKALERFEPGIFDGQPNVKRWWEDITATDSWKVVAAL